ncbi:TadE family protein [Kitasatospora sp. NPDC001540]|uniref:TadE family protein n=1 Tax=Kitasatospora sp. NPDC001540 TaxID=3364014 RepID=UPI0036850668
MEFLLITPLLFVMIFALVQFGLYYFASTVAESAAQAGARRARAAADDDPQWRELARTTASNRIDSLGPALLGDPSITAVQDGDQVGVTVKGRVVQVVPWLDLTVTGTSVGPIERFVPDAG